MKQNFEQSRSITAEQCQYQAKIRTIFRNSSTASWDEKSEGASDFSNALSLMFGVNLGGQAAVFQGIRSECLEVSLT